MHLVKASMIMLYKAFKRSVAFWRLNTSLAWISVWRDGGSVRSTKPRAAKNATGQQRCVRGGILGGAGEPVHSVLVSVSAI